MLGRWEARLGQRHLPLYHQPRRRMSVPRLPRNGCEAHNDTQVVVIQAVVRTKRGQAAHRQVGQKAGVGIVEFGDVGDDSAAKARPADLTDVVSRQNRSGSAAGQHCCDDETCWLHGERKNGDSSMNNSRSGPACRLYPRSCLSTAGTAVTTSRLHYPPKEGCRRTSEVNGQPSYQR